MSGGALPDVSAAQRALCGRFGAPVFPTPMTLTAGVADEVFGDARPWNGLRHPPSADFSGWYVWAGETWSNADDHFKPLHLWHVVEDVPLLARFLALPPGYRFLTDGRYDDVWFDAALLSTD
jgi:hypothetical protein